MLNNLKRYIELNRIDSFFVSKPENVRYISGFTGANAYLLITKTKDYFITDPRYIEQGQKECPEFEVVNWSKDGQNLVGAVGDLLKQYNIKSVALESDYLTHKSYGEFAVRLYADIIPAVGVIESFRLTKNADELKHVRTACQIANRSFEQTIPLIKAGVTELELASKLSFYLITNGADLALNISIVLSGKRSSMVNGLSSHKIIEKGDLVLINYGCGCNGYFCDFTRTVAVGKANENQRNLYDLVKNIQSDSFDSIKPGIKVKDMYKQSTQLLENNEYKKYFYSGLGHGVGLNIHEGPIISPYYEDIIRENNVIAIEPGIYIPDRGGIRIEDQIIVTKTGCESLGTVTRDLIEV